jgi:hypothetical protein
MHINRQQLGEEDPADLVKEVRLEEPFFRTARGNVEPWIPCKLRCAAA